MNAQDRDIEIERLAKAGHSNAEIARLAKCSPQNIDQIRRRIARQEAHPSCVKLTDEQRDADKARLRALFTSNI